MSERVDAARTKSESREEWTIGLYALLTVVLIFLTPLIYDAWEWLVRC